MSTPPHAHRTTFQQCRNIAKGAVFIIASGPSAKAFPFHEFADVPMIAMNGSISMFAGTSIAPFFYVSSDRGFSTQQPELFSMALRKSQRVALWPDQLEKFGSTIIGERYGLEKSGEGSSKKAGNAGLTSLKNRLASVLRKRKRSIGFSQDMSEGFYDARTVAYIALQLAYHLGFRRVFLVGVDLDSAAGRFYETPGMFRSPCNLEDHYQKRILPCLKLLNGLRAKSGFEVYNLSQTSIIPDSVVPKITVDQAQRLVRAKDRKSSGVRCGTWFSAGVTFPLDRSIGTPGRD